MTKHVNDDFKVLLGFRLGKNHWKCKYKSACKYERHLERESIRGGQITLLGNRVLFKSLHKETYYAVLAIGPRVVHMK